MAILKYTAEELCMTIWKLKAKTEWNLRQDPYAVLEPGTHYNEKGFAQRGCENVPSSIHRVDSSNRFVLPLQTRFPIDLISSGELQQWMKLLIQWSIRGDMYQRLESPLLSETSVSWWTWASKILTEFRLLSTRLFLRLMGQAIREKDMETIHVAARSVAWVRAGLMINVTDLGLGLEICLFR
jgi:hypothetical protein